MGWVGLSLACDVRWFGWYHHCTIASLHHCIIVSLHQCINASMHQCIIASLHHCIIASFHHCIIRLHPAQSKGRSLLGPLFSVGKGSLARVTPPPCSCLHIFVFDFLLTDTRQLHRMVSWLRCAKQIASRHLGGQRGTESLQRVVQTQQ